MNRRTSIIICALSLAYFAMTSGLVFEVAKCQSTGSINVPYSIVLSGERTGILGIYNTNDVACARWLAENGKELPIVADYNGFALLMDFYFRNTPPKSANAYYLFLTTWNTQHQKMVIGSQPGLRTYDPLPNLEGATEVFRKGDAIVYYITSD